MNFVFASSHLLEDNRPQADEEEEEDVQPMQRSGMVRAFSHLPQPVQGEPAAPRSFGPSAPTHLPAWLSEPPETEHEPEAETDAGSHGDFEPPATAGSFNNGTIGPVSPRGAPPPAGRSLFLTPRPMPPEYAREQQSGNKAGSAANSRSDSPAPPSTPTHRPKLPCAVQRTASATTHGPTAHRRPAPILPRCPRAAGLMGAAVRRRF